MMSAALNGNTDSIKALIEGAGAQVNAVEKFKGQTALMGAGEGNSAATALLVEYGADVKAKSKGGFTAFLFSVLNNRIDAMKTLKVQHGANLDDRSPDGSTALNVAIINAHLDMASRPRPRSRSEDSRLERRCAALPNVDAQARCVMEAAGTASDPLLSASVRQNPPRSILPRS